jgi:hypothetical protein
LPVAPERPARWAFTRGIPGLKRETRGTLRVFSFAWDYTDGVT